MRCLALLAIALASQPAWALTDYQCVNDCTAKGYLYQVCVDHCSTVNQPQPVQIQPQPGVTPIKRIDYMCLNNCTQAGYSYGYCQSRCEY